jgi:hypothetical protein
VSAFFANGTGSYTDIAKIEGSATYKAYMLGLRGERPQIVAAKYCPFPRQVCLHWPFKSIQIQSPLAPILEALVAAAEATLEMSIHHVAVSAYDVGSIDHQLAKDDVHAALSPLGVDYQYRLGHVAQQLAPALGIQGNCSGPYTLPEDPAYHEDPEKLVFAIEYTRDSMTAGLWREECGVMDMTHRWNSAQLGHNSMQTCRETAENATACEKGFKSALRSVTEDSRRGKHGEIDAVLIFGERADDDAMLLALRQVLQEQFSNGDSVDMSRVRDFSPDPAFAGSRSMAGAVWASQGSEYDHHLVKEL